MFVDYKLKLVLMQCHVVYFRPFYYTAKIRLKNGTVLHTGNVLQDSCVVSKKPDDRPLDTKSHIVDEYDKEKGAKHSPLRYTT